MVCPRLVDIVTTLDILDGNYTVITIEVEMTASAKARFEGTVQPWGNSLGIRITRAMSDMAHIGRGDKVSIEITENGMVISRKKAVKRIKLPYTEADLLAGMTPRKAHADELPCMLAHEVGG